MYPPERASLRCSRTDVCGVLHTLAIDPRSSLGRTALAVVSELVDNAIGHAATHFSVALSLTGTHGMFVEVTDLAPERPVPYPFSEGGAYLGGDRLGLLVVHKLSDAWGVRPVDERAKTVWAQVSLGILNGREHQIAES